MALLLVIIDIPQCLTKYGSSASFSQPSSLWLKLNCESKIIHRSGIPWCIIFPFNCWNIWLLRKKSLFQSPNARDTTDSTINASIAQATEWHFVASPARIPRSKSVVMVNWLHLTPGSFKLNTDGAFKGSLGQASGGGLIRDDEGNWIVDFHRSFRALQGLEAVISALRDGLLLAQSKHLVPLKVEMNALAVIQLIADSNQTRHFLMLDDAAGSGAD